MRRLLRVLGVSVRVLLMGVCFGLAAFCWTRQSVVVARPITPLSALAALASQGPVVRVEGDLSGEAGASASLQRIQIDSGRYRTRLHWRDLLRQRSWPASLPDYDNVSPPVVQLGDGTSTVMLQTEDIDLHYWPPQLDRRVEPGAPYPPEMSERLATLPDLPVLTAPATVRFWSVAPGTHVTVIARVVLQDGSPDLQAPVDEPFVISPLPYQQILDSERQSDTGRRVGGGFLGLCGVGLMLSLVPRRGRPPL